MSITGARTLVVVLCLLLVTSSATAVWFCVTKTTQSIWLAHAAEQVEIFEQMRQQSIDEEPPRAVSYLEYVANYYPSGTKHETGSRLDRIVESARARAIREIIANLRVKTGEDLGDDAGSWIAKYGVK